MRLSRLRIAARHSDLARLQAYRVGESLREKHPELEIEYNFRASLGDMNLQDPLWKMPEKGVFTEDFLRDLIDGTADLVVHSWKDLPTEARPETEIVATLPRADTRDVLLFRKDRRAAAKAQGQARILTSSPRRIYNLEGFLRTALPFSLSEVRFESVRGNIPTRLKKLLSQDVEGLIVAKAALDRLLVAPEAEFADAQNVIREVLSKVHFMVLPCSVNPTAAAQGALAVEVSKRRADVRELLSAINCPHTFAAVEKERHILASYGGGCHQKIGVNVLLREYGEITFLRGLTDRGEVLNRADLKPAPGFGAPPVGPSGTSAKFPSSGDQNPFFARESLPRETWQTAERERFLWVARETAWPDGFKPGEDAVVWTAGLATWKKLAERGVWVNGSAEGLGEEEAPRLEALASCERIEWTKLSHAESGAFAAGQPGMKTVATYRLVTKPQPVDLRGRTHFFWASASSFARALELEPDVIRSGFHACGPGLTYRYIRRVLGPTAPINIVLSRG